jgi:hypothetical protein
MNATTGSIIFMAVLLTVLIVLGPLGILWALNTLFPLLAIPYNFWTWAAVVLLNGSTYARFKLNN